MDELPIVFVDPQGGKHITTSFEEFDEAMRHEDWHIEF